ncbi:ROK family protein [Devosia sp. SL43]|uniref:ROK family protein n=1 Tax=Devosia sp. SL43 TaxID=2806348 RepID=UPI001F3CCB11|nr:ROK family protein [Devosia sp. SL43]
MHILIRNLGGEILGEHRQEYDFPQASTVLKEIASLTQLLVGLVPAEYRSRILGIGLAMPTGIASSASLLDTPVDVAKAWLNLDVAAKIEELTGLRVYAFNDGNAACWAELAAHPVPRPNNIAYLQVGTFIGAGLVAEGRLWEGPSGNSANLGSMMVTDRDGKQQFVHLTASVFALEQRLKASGKPVPKGNPIDWDWSALEPELGEWLDESSRALAKVIINTSAVMEFSVAIVDGVMSRPVVERLVDLVCQRVQEFPVLSSDKPIVEIGRLGGAAAARGAALKPIFRRLFSRDAADIVD